MDQWDHFGVVLLTTVMLVSITSALRTQPHFVTIISDDLGYFDRRSAGNINVTTPNLDALFSEGVGLSHYYGYKYCSPSRRSFVTGRWPLHLGELNQDGAIDLRMQTLGDKLNGVGYKNVLIGKTHWNGQADLHLPINRGWLSHIGFLGGGEAYFSGHECVNETTNCNVFTNKLDMWHNNHPAYDPQYIGKYSTTLFTQLAVETIKNHVISEPLWIHLNYQAVHNPQTSPPGEPHWGDDTSKVFYEVLQAMDKGIGNITRTLKAKGMWSNTVIIFVSDNGAASHGNNYPLRGGKYSPWEGGVRLAAVVSGGVLPKVLVNTTFDGLIHVSDWYPTLCKLAGADPSDSPASDVPPSKWFWPVDGFDIWGYLTGKKENPRSPGTPLVISSQFTSGPGGGCMIMDHWKLVVDARNNGWDQPANSKTSSPKIKGNQTCVNTSSTDKNCIVCSIQKPCIYDVWKDSGEVHNLAKTNYTLLQSMNLTYTKLVYDMRKVVPLNFTEENGWNCKNATPNSSVTVTVRTSPNCTIKPQHQCWRTNDHTIKAIKGVTTAAVCCSACFSTVGCETYSLDVNASKCWLLTAGAKTSIETNCLSGTCTSSPCSDMGGHWGCYLGPQCICLKGVGKCKTN